VTLSDTRGNVYTSVAAPTKYNGGQNSAEVFYAKNIPAGANTVTATFATSVSSFGIVYIHEYSGIDKNSPLDVTTSAVGASGSAMSSGSVTTTNANDLLFGGGVSSATVTQAGSGYTIRSTGSGNVTEDRLVGATGSYSATATHNGSYWAMQIVAFKADAGSVDTTPPSVPANLSAAAVSASQVNLSWTASTDNVGVTGYRVYRNGAQIGTTTQTSFPDTGLLAGTGYTYTVSAYDAAGNSSAQSAPATATTLPAPDTTAPTVPTNVSATAVSTSQISVTWNASTDNVGVTGYAVYRDGAQVGTSAQPGYQDTGLSPNTTHSYTVAAYDAAGNTSAQSAPVSVTTLSPPDTTPPTVSVTSPSAGSTLTGIVNVSATAGDNVGVSRVEFSVDGQLVNTDTSSPYGFSLDTTTLANGSHTITATAFDAAGNAGTSAVNVTVSNSQPDTTPPSAPTDLAASLVSASAVSLTWTASTDNVGVTGYLVLRNGAQIGTSSGTSYSDGSVAASTSYGYTIEAVDAAGNVSAPSSTLSVTTPAPPAGPVYPLKVSPNGRYLVDQTGAPFLVVGDAPQPLIGDLSEADAATYFADRQKEGFDAVWINLLCGSYTYCNSNGTTFDGIAPFTSGNSPADYDLTTPNPAYFQRADDMIRLAAQHGIVVFLDPAETGSWLTTLRNNGGTKAFDYGVYLGNRYKSFPNIVWMSGNDFQSYGNSTDANLVLSVMEGIHSVDPNQLQTAELAYWASSSLDSPILAPMITLNAAYTYYPTYAEVLYAYNQSSTVPTFMVEANYEFENNTGNDLGTPALLRQQEYWTMLSGATGQLYGNHHTVSFDADWQSYLDTTGATQLGYETRLLTSLPWYELVPDQNHSVVTAGYGTFASTGPVHTNDYATAARASDGSVVVVYMPTSRTITVDLSKLASTVTARWFDPTNGAYTPVPGSPFPNTGTRQFTPPGPNAEGSGDWVLLLQGPDSQPPSAPANLSVTPRSASRLDLSWTASTDNEGVAGYEVTRDGAPIASTAGTTYSDTGLAPDTTYSYSVQALDAAGNISGPSNTVTVTTPLPDTTAPSVPTNLQASGVGAQSATLSWAASTDDLGVAGYRVYRNGVQIADTGALSYVDGGLTASTTYQYTVAAYDYSGNVSPQSSALQVTTSGAPAPAPAFVQLAERTATASSSTASTAGFSAATKSGDTIIVWVWYNSNAQSVTSVTDTAGDTYARAVGPTTGTGTQGAWRQELWYARNIVGKSGVVVTATFSGTFSGEKALTAHEYSGLDPVAPLDATSASVVTAANATSGAVTTAYPRELIFGAAIFAGVGTSGSGFTQRSWIAENASEDKVVSSIGSYAATFTNVSQPVVVQMATFKAAGQ